MIASILISLLLVLEPTTAWATGFIPWSSQYCSFCGMNNNQSFYPMGQSSFFNYNPWWSGYGRMAYSNFGCPGAWNGWGMQGSMYPHRGGGFMGKPNVYVSAKPGTKVSVKVKMKEDSEWLVAVPSHGSSGWSATVNPDGSLETGKNEKHRFFFYDFRCDSEKLQDEVGFCSHPDDLMDQLVSTLQSQKFSEAEIKDFKEYWSVKLPPSKRYCVFPQFSEDLNQVTELEIHPKPDKLIRVSFMIVPEETRKLAVSHKKFRNLPKKIMVPSVSPISTITRYD